MTITILIIGIIVGVGVSYVLFHHRLGGDYEVDERIEEKQDNLEKIINLLEEKGEVSNSDIRDVLNISSRTVVRYMDKLEEQGRVEQVGEAGASVVYKLK